MTTSHRPAAAGRTRGRLVAAAAACFADHGIERVSLDEIARAAAVHRATLHRHFPGGRDELVIAVLDHEVEGLATAMLQLIDDAPTAADALREALTFAVVEGRRSKVVAALLSEPAARGVVMGPAAVQLRSTASVFWRTVRDRADAEAGPARRWPSTDRVVDHLFRVLLNLVDDPGPVRSPARVRNYMGDFVVPTLLP